MEIRTLLAYADNSLALLRKTLAAHQDALDRPFETIAEFKTIRQLIAHMVGAEERWTIQRVAGRDLPSRYESRAADTLDALFADWAAVRSQTRAFVEAGDLARPVEFSLPQWGYADRLSLEEVLFQVLNHQTFHTAQISMALQQMRIDPPNFDYVMLHGSRDSGE